MKRKDLEALIHLANPDQPVKDFTKNGLRFVLINNIMHLKYRADNPAMFVKHIRLADEIIPANVPRQKPLTRG